ncbi:MAG: hypothetical protein AAB649_00940 [Patescibacteria group bacterium]
MRHTLTLVYLSEISGLSVTTLSTRFQQYLVSPPTPQTYLIKLKTTLIWSTCTGYLLIDADWFGNRCIITYRDSKAGLLYWSIAGGEYLTVVRHDIETLVAEGYPLKVAVFDGKKSMDSACRGLSIPIQRCLVHIQTRIQTLLTQHPQTEAGRDLLLLSEHINYLGTAYEAKILIRWFVRLYKRHYQFFTERTLNDDLSKKTPKWWYTHPYLRQAYQHLYQALPNMFTYLRYDDLPKDNNSSEGSYSQLDNKILIHRGMMQNPKENLISWYFYLTRFYPPNG